MLWIPNYCLTIIWSNLLYFKTYKKKTFLKLFRLQWSLSFAIFFLAKQNWYANALTYVCFTKQHWPTLNRISYAHIWVATCRQIYSQLLVILIGKKTQETIIQHLLFNGLSDTIAFSNQYTSRSQTCLINIGHFRFSEFNYRHLQWGLTEKVEV